MFQVVEVKFQIVGSGEAVKPRVIRAFEKRGPAKELADKLNHKHDLVSLDCITNYHVKEIRNGACK